ncbi:ribosome small subunit-dependent GTPase A [Oceanobacillus chungangensis]|uniref:Small ribosomal subunit biogenesis GTPase RsgA n=1 Tax=Oceanobacillus chungangensis TaxID=1229152 RepID=A0A3D8Q2D2_9BACI|nr:ribosome small subunit-dependent GTPase A [Oceanobacillus chungangensis]RDW21185.1 ribosome small subunit-dependent GTPase A [Oceanobacillus chungangensis]
MNNLIKLGWESPNTAINTEFIARVITVQKNSYRISDGEMEYLAHLSGKFLNEATSVLDFPAVGDWVEVQKLADEQKAVINQVLPRKSQFVRQAAGLRTEAQIVATNIDTIFIVNSLNHDLNMRRIERYVLAAYESGASPAIVLTKKDECSQEEVDTAITEVESVAIGIPIIAVSSVTKDGIEELMKLLPTGRTAALLGSSGVGKSTLVNTLLEKQVQDTKGIRESDSKGRHTTTHREMFMLPNGALMIDTPGMRELQLWEGESAIDATFQDVEELAANCRFTDCRHELEPGCAVREALDNGELPEGRFQNYVKLQRELAYEKRKQDQKAQQEERNKWKQVSKDLKSKYKRRG